MNNVDSFVFRSIFGTDSSDGKKKIQGTESMQKKKTVIPSTKPGSDLWDFIHTQIKVRAAKVLF